MGSRPQKREPSKSAKEQEQVTKQVFAREKLPLIVAGGEKTEISSELLQEMAKVENGYKATAAFIDFSTGL